MSGEQRIATAWFAWVLGGAAIGLFAARRTLPRHPIRAVRLAMVIVGTALIVDASSALAADSEYYQGMIQSSPGLTAPRFERAVILRPFEPVYHQELGMNLVRVGRETNDPNLFRSAIDHLERALALSGGRDPELLSQLATVTSEWETAMGQATDTPFEYARQAIDVDPGNPLLYLAAAEVAVRARRPDVARAYWESARLRSATPDALHRLGDVAILLDDSMAARDAFRESARREWRRPYRAEHYLAWGEAALSVGLLDEAASAFGEVVRLDPQDLTTWVKFIEALAASGQHEAARQEAQRLLTQTPAEFMPADLVERLRRI